MNFQHKLLNGIHDFPCSTFKELYYVQGWGPCGMGGNIGISPGKLRTCHPIPTHEFHATCEWE